MQEAAAGGVGVLAQVEGEFPLGHLRPEAQGALEPVQIALERHGGRPVGHLAQGVADDEPVPDQGERHVGAVAHHRPDGVGRLGEPRQRAAAHRGERPGESHGLDDVGGRHRVVLLAEQPGGLRHPPLDRPVGHGEQVLVPSGRVDPGAVPGAAGEPAVRPRHPGGLGPDPGEALEEGPVGGDGALPGERRDVPGTADDGDGAVFPEGCAQPEPHVRLADGVAGAAAVPVRLAQRRHRLRDGRERGERVARVRRAVLDDVLPPALRVVVPGGRGQYGEGVDAQSAAPPVGGRPARVVVRVLLVLVLPGGVAHHGEGVGGGQVDEADGGTVVERPADGDPLGREGGERPERGPSGVVGGVCQQGDRRSHPLVGGERQQGVGLRRALDQHGPGAGRVEGGADRARRAGSVVAHSEQQGVGHAETSRQAR